VQKAFPLPANTTTFVSAHFVEGMYDMIFNISVLQLVLNERVMFVVYFTCDKIWSSSVRVWIMSLLSALNFAGLFIDNLTTPLPIYCFNTKQDIVAIYGYVKPGEDRSREPAVRSLLVELSLCTTCCFLFSTSLCENR
jgi:hypothetical protein